MSDVKQFDAEVAAPTSPILTQVYASTPCLPQGGGKQIVNTAVIDVGNGGPAVMFWQASVSVSGTAPCGQKLVPVVNGDAEGGLGTAMFYNQNALNLPMVKRRGLVTPLPAGESMLTVMASAGAVTSFNDSVSMALVDVSDMDAPPQVRLSEYGAATGASGEYFTLPFNCNGGPLLISVAATAWCQAIDVPIGATLYLDGDPIASVGVFANYESLHMPLVGNDVVVQPSAGGHQLWLMADNGTTVDTNDIWSINVMEMQAPSTATMLAYNQPCPVQGGGGTLVSAPYQSRGGALLFCVSLSAWTQTAGSILRAHLLVDGNPVGSLQLFAAWRVTHFAMCGGDIVAGSPPAGSHTIEIVADDGTLTDYNDVCSVTVLEFFA